MNKPLKPIPKFASEAEERAFWETPDNDSTAYLDLSKAKRAVFPNLKPSTQAISLRLPVSLLSAALSNDTGNRSEIACVDGLRFGKTARFAFDKSRYAVLSLSGVSQKARSSASDANFGMGLRGLFIKFPLFVAHGAR